VIRVPVPSRSDIAPRRGASSHACGWPFGGVFVLLAHAQACTSEVEGAGMT